jgi:serine protease Do
MRREILTALVAIPFLFHSSHAAQSWNGAAGQQYFGWPGEEGGTGAYLGVDVCDVTPDRLGALKLKEEKGVEVTMVDQDAPAGKAGIKEHDVILSVNGTPVDSAAQLRRVIHETPASRIVSLGLSRDGQPLTVKTQLAERSHVASWPQVKPFKDFQVNVMPSIPEMPEVANLDVPGAMVVVRSSARSGLTVENLTPQLGEFFGVKDGRGVLVRGVDKGSRAEKAGLRAGDVIVRINDQPVHDTTDFSYAMRRSGKGKGVSLGVMREKHEQTLSMQQPENKESGEVIEEGLGSDDLEFDADDMDQLGEVENLMAKVQPQLEIASRIVADAASGQSRKIALDHQKQLQEKVEILTDKVKSRTQKQMHELERTLRQRVKAAPLDI